MQLKYKGEPTVVSSTNDLLWLAIGSNQPNKEAITRMASQ